MLLTSTELHSATQGSIGALSSGSMTITLITSCRLKVTANNEIPINKPMLQKKTSTRKSIAFCVRSNGLSNYSITAEGYNQEGDFILKNGNRMIPYVVLLETIVDQNPIPLYKKKPSASLHSLSISEKCKDTPRISLQLKRPLDYGRTIIGAMHITISID